MSPESRWIGIFSAVVLLIGILLGIAMDRTLFKPPPPPQEGAGTAPALTEGPPGSRMGRRLMDRMTRALDMDERQREEISGVFRSYLPRLREARRGDGDFRAIRKEMREEITKILTPEQQEKFRAMTRMDRERRERFRERVEQKYRAK